MNREQLNEVLEKHEMWLNYEEGGERANFTGANLYYADFKGAALQESDFTGATLRGANFTGANLRYADFTGADIDLSCLPLWCGGLDFKIDERIAKQLMYHVVNLMQYSGLPIDKYVKKAMYKWLEDSHLVTKCGLPVLKHKEEER